jgi:plastocyanin
VRGPSAQRYLVLLSALCVACGAWVAIAIGAPRHTAHHRPSHTAKACHRTKHRHCPKTRVEQGFRHKHAPHTSAKPSKPTSNDPHPGPPGSTLPPLGAPASPSGSRATRPGPVENAPPAKSPTATTPVAPTHVEVTAEDTEGFRFVLSRPTVPAGKVIIEFVNHGQDEHNLNAVEPTEGSVEGSLPNTAPNAHLSLTVNLRPGSYTLFCSLPGHEAKGMKATLVVE